MADTGWHSLLHHLRRMAGSSVAGGLSDGHSWTALPRTAMRLPLKCWSSAMGPWCCRSASACGGGRGGGSSV